MQEASSHRCGIGLLLARVSITTWPGGICTCSEVREVIPRWTTNAHTNCQIISIGGLELASGCYYSQVEVATRTSGLGLDLRERQHGTCLELTKPQIQIAEGSKSHCKCHQLLEALFILSLLQWPIVQLQ